MRTAISTIQATHLAEVERMQKANQKTVEVITERLTEVAKKQEQAAQQIDRAAREARSAAAAAGTAAKNAANANIRITEVTPRKEMNLND